MKKEILSALGTTDWWYFLKDEVDKEYFTSLAKFVDDAYESHTIYPPQSEIFNAFTLTSFKDVKVVVLGQDPYHGENQANGLAFSVKEGQKLPPSLKNIYKELQSDVAIQNLDSGNLESWAKQGVLLLNATLTVEAKKPGSHQHRGWELFTDAIIKKLSEQKEQLVFVLWGAYAQKKGEHIDRAKHLVIESVHPSPFSVHKGFYGSKPFSKTNAYLKDKGKSPIDWNVKSLDLFSL